MISGILATGFVAMHIHREEVKLVMDDIRKGQIAYLFVKKHLREKGVRLAPALHREIGNEAKAIGISADEFREFAEIVIREMVEETFAKKPDKRS